LAFKLGATKKTGGRGGLKGVKEENIFQNGRRESRGREQNGIFQVDVDEQDAQLKTS